MPGLNLVTLPDGRKAVIIRTSDRISFKKCRRSWAFSSHLKRNLAPNLLASPLWFGSAIHYALEDYHGYNYFGRPADAFRAYCLATAHNYKRELPSDARELYQMGGAMMDYYVDMWLENYPRKADQTYWAPAPITGTLIPQIEVNFEIPVPIEQYPTIHEHCIRQGIDVVLYRGTIDRVSIDEWGQLWCVEYKTAKVAQNTHFATDPQVSTYVWAMSHIYDLPVAGVVYQQFVKRTPELPKVLSSGRLSTAANQVTSVPLYRKQLENMYGSIMKAPHQNQEYFNRLIRGENTDRDRFIIREPIHRNADQCQHEAQKILLELEDMLNPDLPLYPNPTRDCTRMCSFVSPCVNLDDGSDWESLLDMQYSQRDGALERVWRQRLPNPEALAARNVAEPEGPDFDKIQLESQRTAEEEEALKQAEIAAGDYPLAEWEADKADPMSHMDERGNINLTTY